jgi:hypothetical protein
MAQSGGDKWVDFGSVLLYSLWSSPLYATDFHFLIHLRLAFFSIALECGFLGEL